MLVPLVVDQPPARHQIEHGRHDPAVEPWRRHLAVFRKSPLVLRPQPMNDKRIRPLTALRSRRRTVRCALGGLLAKRRRPRQRQHIEIKAPDRILAAVLKLREDFTEGCAKAGVTLRVPPPRLCTDNAAMVACLASYRLAAGHRDDRHQGHRSHGAAVQRPS